MTRLILLFLALCSTKSMAQQAISVEERFQDVFLTAGYSSAFGAALGTALLAWTTNPSENLKYVAIGASLGFIGGSVLGTYVVLQPMAGPVELPKNHLKMPRLVLAPWVPAKGTHPGMSAQWTALTF